MSSKQDFTDEEWIRIRRAPLVAGVAISLADPGGRRVAFYQMHARFNRSFVDSRHRIIVEVGLLDRASSRRDLAHQRDAGAEDRRALEL